MCRSKQRYDSSIKTGPNEGCEKDRGQRRVFVNKVTELWIQSNTTVKEWRYSAEPKANDKPQCRHKGSFHLHKSSLKLTNSKYL
jgi:hypothetical protein